MKYKKNKCLNCGKLFEKKPKDTKIGWETRKFCSPDCFHEHRVGIPQSEEARKKISKKLKGIVPKNFSFMQKLGQLSGIGRIPWNKGMKGFMAGEANPSWKGGVTPINQKIRTSVEYQLWRTSVFARDGYRCQDCGVEGVYIEAHHIKPFAFYPELRFAIDNGLTLCKECHKKTDSFAGKGYKRK